VLEEERVVPDAEADDDVEVGPALGQDGGLADGVAGRLVLPRPDLVPVLKTEFVLKGMPRRLEPLLRANSTVSLTRGHSR
jgi:hypothetical protein